MKKLFTNPYDPYEDHDRWSRYELKRSTAVAIVALMVLITFLASCTKHAPSEPAPADKRIQDTVQRWQGWDNKPKN